MSSGSCVNSTPVIDGIGWYFLSPSVSGETDTELVNRLNANRIYSGSVIDICSNVYYHNIRDSSANGFPNDSIWSQSDWCIANIDDVLLTSIGYWIYIISYDLIGYQYVTVKWWSGDWTASLPPSSSSTVTAYLVNDPTKANEYRNNIQTPDTAKYISKESSPFKAALGYNAVSSTTITFELLDISTNLDITGIEFKPTSTSGTRFAISQNRSNSRPNQWHMPWFAVEIVSVTDAQGNVTNQTRQTYYDDFLFKKDGVSGTFLLYNTGDDNPDRALNITSNLKGHILSIYYDQLRISNGNDKTYANGELLINKGDTNAGNLASANPTSLFISGFTYNQDFYFSPIYFTGASVSGNMRIGRSLQSTTGGYGHYSVFSLS